jgi:hypothetical protein
LHTDLDNRPDIAVSQYAALLLQFDRIQEDYPDVDISDFDKSLSSIDADGYKLVCDARGTEELFEVTGMGSGVDISPAQDKDVLDNLQEQLDKYDKSIEKAMSDAGELNSAIEGRLKDLGYYQ